MNGNPMQIGMLSALVRREWMEHGWQWLFLVTLPQLCVVLLAVGIMLFKHILPEAPIGADHLRITMALLWSPFVLTLPAATLIILFLSSGMIRSEIDNRSIEFWRSLPMQDSVVLAVKIAMLILGVPVLAWLVSFLGHYLLMLALIVLTLIKGTSPDVQILLSDFLVIEGKLLASMPFNLLGILSSSVWILFPVLLLMNAGAWLKRMGTLAFVVLLSVSLLVEKENSAERPLSQFCMSLLQNGVLNPLLENVGVFFGRPGAQAQIPDLASQTHEKLAAFGSPHFAIVAIGSAILFALLVWKRKRA